MFVRCPNYLVVCTPVVHPAYLELHLFQGVSASGLPEFDIPLIAKTSFSILSFKPPFGKNVADTDIDLHRYPIVTLITSMLLLLYLSAAISVTCLAAAPPSPTLTPPPHTDPKDVTLAISADSFNSAGKVYANANALRYTGTLTGITTAQFKDVIPSAYKLCPNCPLSFTAQADRSSPPVVSISQAKGAAVAVSNVVVNVTTASASATAPATATYPLFVLSVQGNGGVKFSNTPSGSGEFIKLLATINDVKLAVISSSIGIIPNIAIPVLNPLVFQMLQLATAAFNTFFPGFPLPRLSGFDISNLLIETAHNQISVSLDIAPTTLRTPLQLQPTIPSPQALPPGFSGPGFSAVVGGQGLDKVLGALLPKLVAKVNGMTLPALSGVAKGITYETDPIHVANFNIDQSAIRTIAGEGILLSLKNISLAIPSTKFKLSKYIFHCSGHMSGALVDTSVDILLNVTANQTVPQITSNSSWQFGALNVSETLDSSVCRVIQNVASWFVGNINEFIGTEMKKLLPSTFDAVITDDGNQVLHELILTQNIDDVASVNFYLTENPWSTNETMEIDLSGAFVPAG